MRVLLTLSFLLLSVLGVSAEDENLQIGLSDDSVAITSNFDGANVVVFGTIDNGTDDDLLNARYDIVVVVTGPESEMVVRQKERRFGVWVNGEALPFERVPSFYSIASNRPLSEIADDKTLSEQSLGFGNIAINAKQSSASPQQAAVFRASLTRLMASRSLSLKREDGVNFLSPTLFRARLAVPANVPIGRHTARAYLFKRGELLSKKAARLAVRKTGFEQYTYRLAHKYGLLYGIIAVLIAIATGWLASVVFRKD